MQARGQLTSSRLIGPIGLTKRSRRAADMERLNENTRP
jgi:hypothetical protein